METIFENFIEYCKEDNEQLAKDIETWLADYFDLPNRTIPLEMNEEDWICKNLSEENQVRILGYKAKGYNLRFNLNKLNCDRCNIKLYRKGDLYEDEIVEEDDIIIETIEGHILCNECDCERLSRINNPDNQKTEEEFWEEVIVNMDKRKNEN